MPSIRSTMQLILHGGDLPVEVDVQPRPGSDSLVALFATARWQDTDLCISGNPEDVRAWANNLLDAVDEGMASLTPCQRRGKHNYEPSGPEDGCLDCSMEPLAAPVLVATGNVPF